MILLQRPNLSAARQWITIARLIGHLGAGQHHASTLYVCDRCGNPSWRRVVSGSDSSLYNVEKHPCAECGGFFPLVDSDLMYARDEPEEVRIALANLGLAHPHPTIRTYLHHYQEPRHHD